MSTAQEQQGYYRFPAIHGTNVVFAAEGDLWRGDLAGGPAVRLTTHAGDESHVTVSPDGSTIAFSATYEGPTEVHTMPITGGRPTRHTFEGSTAQVMGWTPDGRILYTTRKYSTLPSAQLVALDPRTHTKSMVPLAQAAEGSYDATRGALFFTRLSKQGSTVKRYQGGTAQNLWKFDGKSEAAPLTTDYPGTSRWPMWWNERVYFVSDRDGHMNLWSMTEDGGDLVQHTQHTGWDIQTPTLHEGRVVYQLGADLWLFDSRTDENRIIPLTLPSDFEQMRERWITDPMDYLSSAHLSPNGDRVVLTAHGEGFVAPVEQGRFVEVTRAADVRYRSARFLDEETLAVLSDESGEVEWWTTSALGVGDRRQTTTDGTILRFDGEPSPDGEWIVHWNQDDELWISSVANGSSRKIAFSQGGFGGPAWSPDSRWIAYAGSAANQFSQLFVYDVESGTSTSITTDRFNDTSPQWSKDGKWIYFLSDRNFESLVRSPWGSRAPEPYLDRQWKLYGIPLVEGLRSPFQPDDEFVRDQDDDDTQGQDEQVDVAIDFEGIERRLIELPIEPGNYRGLSVGEKRLFWISRETAMPRSSDLVFKEINNETDDPETLVEGINSYELSADGKKLLVRKGDAIHVIDASSGAPAKLEDTRVDLSDWTFSLDPREEWRQLFVDAWRLERDYFYDRNMHGVDWDGMLGKYTPLLDRVRSRAELSDLMTQMAGEISALHTRVRGGDLREGSDQVAPASLGAVLARAENGGGYRVNHIYRSDPDIPTELSPLAQHGVNVREGDVITHINGTEVLSVLDPGALLRNRAGKQTRLTVKTANGQTRDVIVTPISQERDSDLRYDEWEYTRRLAAEEMGGGDIGYVHLRAMGRNNIHEWFREYYPVFNRRGLILDARNNRGGNIDAWILSRLLRKAWMYWKPRAGDVYWNMHHAFRGHMVVLVNEWTASDGEAFAEGFKRLGLGQVIGTRTWGGEIWLSNNNRLADRGLMSAAETGVYGPEGIWLIEGYGVDPDIIVDNLPHATFNGDDAQLRAGVEHLLRLIREDPRDVPVAPDYPDKSAPDNRRRTVSNR